MKPLSYLICQVATKVMETGIEVIIDELLDTGRRPLRR